MTLFYSWYKRHLRRRRQIRKKEIERSLSHCNCNENEPYGNGGDYAEYTSEREAAALAVDPWFLSGRQGRKSQQTQEAERIGLLVEIQSPTRGLRRSLRRDYLQEPRYDESRINQGSNGIHPIDEEDEIESMSEMSERSQTSENCISTPSAAYLATDPDPLRGRPVLPPQNLVHFPTSLKNTNNPQNPQPGPSSLMQARITDVRSYSPNWELIAYSSSSGRSSRESTDKSDRTESNLSDQSQSARSALSTLSARPGAASVARTLSNASATILSRFGNPFSTPNVSLVNERQRLSLQIPAGAHQAARQSGESFSNNSRAHADDDSFRTAKTSFAKLQAEGEALLGGRPNDINDLPAPSTQPSSSGSDRQSPKLIHTPVDFYAKPSLDPSREQDPDTTPVHGNEEALYKLAHTASSDTLNLTTPINSSFVTRDRSKSWIRGSIRLALSQRPSSSRRHSNSHDRTQSLKLSGYLRRRHTNDDDGSGLFGSGGIGGSGISSPTKLRRYRRSGSGVGVGESVSGTRPSVAGDSPSPPRRANSDASFWKSKRGSKAWSEDAPPPMWQSDVRDERDWALPTPDPGKSRESLVALIEGGDWDFEATAEGRVVPVIFTMPRQRLRVVNVDKDQGGWHTSNET